MMHECGDHIIGMYYDGGDDCELITLPDLKEKIEENRQFAEWCVENHYKAFKADAYTLEDYVDGRKTVNMVRFDYCPSCGKKINRKEWLNPT